MSLFATSGTHCDRPITRCAIFLLFCKAYLINLGLEEARLLADLVVLDLLSLAADKLLVGDVGVHLVLQGLHLLPELGQPFPTRLKFDTWTVSETI